MNRLAMCLLTICWFSSHHLLAQRIFSKAAGTLQTVQTLQPGLTKTELNTLQPIQPEKRCGTELEYTRLREQYPEMESRAEFEAWLAHQSHPSTRAVVTIPIVVHIVHDNETVGTGNNISETQVLSQLAVLNADYRRLNADTTNTPPAFQPVAADAEIEFCLAVLDPSDNLMAEPGINRIDRNAMGWAAPTFDAGTGITGWTNTYVINNMLASTQWDPTEYLNLWVVPINDGFLGFAYYPTSSGLPGIPNNNVATRDGVVINRFAFGTVGVLLNNYNGGRTATHEIGHFLGLIHTWGDGDCSVDDFCGDTPNCDDFHMGCPSGFTSCSSVDMVENFLDYTDDACMNLFTENQKTRMLTVLANSPRRMELTSSDRCDPPQPYVSFEYSGASVTEFITTGTDCDRFFDIEVSLEIAKAPVGDATITMTAGAATAIDPDDYTFPSGNTALFPNGGNTNQTITLRIFDDALIEGIETVDFSFTISGTTDAVNSPFNQTFTLFIIDDDRSATDGLDVLFWEDFEGSLSGWVDGSFLPGGNNVWLANNDAPIDGSISAHVGINSGPATTYDKSSTSSIALRSPLINAVGKSGLQLQLLYACNGQDNLDYGILYYSLDGNNFFAFSSAIFGVSTASAGVINLPAAVDNQNFYLGFGWENNNDGLGDDPPFVIDNVKVVTQTATTIESTLDASREQELGPGATVHFYSETSDELIATITNLGTYDYGCVEVEIDRAGTDATMFWDNADNQHDLADKTILVTAENNNPGGNGNYQITLYFTKAEIDGWIAATGGANTPATANIVKSPGAISNVSPATPYPDGPINVESPFFTTIGGDFAYTATFTNGFSGFGLGNPGTPPLPIEYLHFEAMPQGNDVQLTWVSAQKEGVESFTVERSFDGTGFEPIYLLEDRQSIQHNDELKYTDANILLQESEYIYYRIKGLDIEGEVYYTEIRSVKRPLLDLRMGVYPIPFDSEIQVHLELANDRTVRFQLFDINGRIQYDHHQAFRTGRHSWQIPATKLPKGVYFLRVHTGDRWLSQKLMN